MKNPDAAWDDTTVTTFGYRNYGVRSKRYRYIVYKDGTEELYDHTKDKWEWTNLAGSPESAGAARGGAAELAGFTDSRRRFCVSVDDGQTWIRG